MKAQNELLVEWLRDAKRGKIQLPRFQRPFVWKSRMTIKFLTAILEEKPPGIFLTLQANIENPLFEDRYIDGAKGDENKKCDYYLLDGQQRLTALWKALNDEFDDAVYYFEFNTTYEITDIKCQRRETLSGNRIIGNPREEYKKNWFPVSLVNPTDYNSVFNDWVEGLEIDDSRKIKSLIEKTRQTFLDTEIPYFVLSSSTSDRSEARKEAIETFQDINTNSARLSHHYLAEAEMEASTGASLHEMAKRLKSQVPEIEDLETDDLGELLLKIFCVMKNKAPMSSAYQNLPFQELLDQEKTIFAGIKWAVQQLGELQIWKGSQLPTVVPLRILPVLHKSIPKTGTAEMAAADKVIKKYMWHAFLTNRYSKQANNRLKKDFDDLAKLISKEIHDSQVEIFNEARRPSEDDIKGASWPQQSARSILPRGILLVCCQEGARALVRNKYLNVNSVENRDRHHIFPKSRLKGIKNIQANLALNCMLIPREENNEFRDDLPGDYINKLNAKLDTPLPETSILEALDTHLIPKNVAKILFQTKNEKIQNSEIRLKDKYKKFLERRASIVKIKIDQLLDGE